MSSSYVEVRESENGTDEGRILQFEVNPCESNGIDAPIILDSEPPKDHTYNKDPEIKEDGLLEGRLDSTENDSSIKKHNKSSKSSRVRVPKVRSPHKESKPRHKEVKTSRRKNDGEKALESKMEVDSETADGTLDVKKGEDSNMTPESSLLKKINRKRKIPEEKSSDGMAEKKSKSEIADPSLEDEDAVKADNKISAVGEQEVTAEVPDKKEKEKATKDKERSTKDKEKSTKDKEKSTKEKEKSTKDKEKSTKNKEKSSKDKEKSTKDKEKSTKDKEKSSKDKEKSTKDKEQSTKDKEKSIKDKEKSSKDKELSSKDKEKSTKDKEKSTKDKEKSTKDNEKEKSVKNKEKEKSTKDKEKEKSTKDKEKEKSTKDKEKEKSTKETEKSADDKEESVDNAETLKRPIKKTKKVLESEEQDKSKEPKANLEEKAVPSAKKGKDVGDSNPGLPEGWTRKIVVRKSGKTAGDFDLYIYSPDGKKFRSRPDIAAYLARIKSDLKVDDFNFTKRGITIDSASPAPVAPTKRKKDSSKTEKPKKKSNTTSASSGKKGQKLVVKLSINSNKKRLLSSKDREESQKKKK